jgi:hypothetical protein
MLKLVLHIEPLGIKGLSRSALLKFHPDGVSSFGEATWEWRHYHDLPISGR